MRYCLTSFTLAGLVKILKSGTNVAVEGSEEAIRKDCTTTGTSPFEKAPNNNESQKVENNLGKIIHPDFSLKKSGGESNVSCQMSTGSNDNCEIL